MSGLLDLENEYKAYRLRQQNLNDPLNYALLAPPEHQEMARNAVRDNPWLMAPALTVGAPIYQLMKSKYIRPIAERIPNPLGGAGEMMVNQDASPQDLDQMWAAYKGIGQGLFGR